MGISFVESFDLIVLKASKIQYYFTIASIATGEMKNNFMQRKCASVKKKQNKTKIDEYLMGAERCAGVR